MPVSGSQPSQQTASTAPGRLRSAQKWLVGAFSLHVRLFLGVNVILTTVNAATGRSWWALWPLLATAVLLGLHYLIYKTAVVDEQWVEERSQELNLKSYDRGHIEDLKARYKA